MAGPQKVMRIAESACWLVSAAAQNYEGLHDHGMALRAALTDGTSRHGSQSGHGHGFRDVFTGLMNLQGTLRFRSGDHALIMDGTSPTLATAQLAQKAMIAGLFTSVRCEARTTKS